VPVPDSGSSSSRRAPLFPEALASRALAPPLANPSLAAVANPLHRCLSKTRGGRRCRLFVPLCPPSPIQAYQSWFPPHRAIRRLHHAVAILTALGESVAPSDYHLCNHTSVVWYCAHFCTAWLGSKFLELLRDLWGKDVKPMQSVKLID
jgi:hypothetical protein